MIMNWPEEQCVHVSSGGDDESSSHCSHVFSCWMSPLSDLLESIVLKSVAQRQ